MQSRPHFIRRPEARSSLRVNSERSELTLFWRIFLPNAALLLLAGALLVLSPAEVDSSPSAGQAGALEDEQLAGHGPEPEEQRDHVLDVVENA